MRERNLDSSLSFFYKRLLVGEKEAFTPSSLVSIIKASTAGSLIPASNIRSKKLTQSDLSNRGQRPGLTGTPHIQPKYRADTPPTPQLSHKKPQSGCLAPKPSSLSLSLARSVLSFPSSIPISSTTMSSSGSDFGSGLDYEEEMALRIALERSKVKTGGSSKSGVCHSSRVGAEKTPELDPPGPRAAMPEQRSPHQPRAISFPHRPLLHAGGVGASVRAAGRSAPRATRGSMHGRGIRWSSPRAAAAGWRRTSTRMCGSSYGSTAGPS